MKGTGAVEVVELHADRVDILRGSLFLFAFAPAPKRALVSLTAVRTLSFSFFLSLRHLNFARTIGAVLFQFGVVLRIFPFVDVVLFGAALAPAVPAAVAKFCASLGKRHYADACFFGFVGMFTHFAALLSDMDTYLYLTSF
jgi:hypothetical protein